MSGRILIWGQSDFISAAFLKRIAERSSGEITAVNVPISESSSRAVTLLAFDREDPGQCRQMLASSKWDWVIDFGANTHNHIENTIPNCRFDHYTFFSSSTVDLSWPDDSLFAFAQNKLWCEHLLSNACSKLLTIRAAYVVGAGDPSDRFEFRGGIWYWMGREDPVQPVVTVDLLTGLMTELVLRKHTGIVRAGYAVSRVKQTQS